MPDDTTTRAILAEALEICRLYDHDTTARAIHDRIEALINRTVPEEEDPGYVDVIANYVLDAPTAEKRRRRLTSALRRARENGEECGRGSGLWKAQRETKKRLTELAAAEPASSLSDEIVAGIATAYLFLQNNQNKGSARDALACILPHVPALLASYREAETLRAEQAMALPECLHCGLQNIATAWGLRHRARHGDMPEAHHLISAVARLLAESLREHSIDEMTTCLSSLGEAVANVRVELERRDGAATHEPPEALQ